MSRTAAVVWHALFSVVAGLLYFFFVLPRWWELSGDTSPTLGTVLRIVTGVLIGLAALPVVFTWLRTKRPEYGTPELALRLRLYAIALHVLGGVLIVGAAVSEIWFSLDDAGQWLFGIYGAAAAICLLGIGAFYLAFIAELPPPPPKPLKKKKERKVRRRRRKGKDVEESDETEPDEESDETQADDQEADEVDDTVTAETAEGTHETADETAAETDDEPEEPEEADDEPPAAEDTIAEEPVRGGLRNKRPSGKFRRPRRRRNSGGVAVDE